MLGDTLEGRMQSVGLELVPEVRGAGVERTSQSSQHQQGHMAAKAGSNRSEWHRRKPHPKNFPHDASGSCGKVSKEKVGEEALLRG